MLHGHTYENFFIRAIMSPSFVKQALVWSEKNFEEMEKILCNEIHTEPLTDEAIIDNLMEATAGVIKINLRRTKQTDAVLREISRIHTTFDLNYRVSTRKKILDGYVIPAETQIYIHQYGINKHKALWTNPEKFNPDRFLNNREKTLNLTFGGGIRMCPGQSLAMMELKTYMVLMYRKYDFELVELVEVVMN
ncbi:14835_t:CDS:2 [Funneliformis geosporum]|uniref:19634_t:CDS:1 n=1 Tax=Funneliformis geosporum TaxID=1117311 RepID=A0A9W4WIV3_9GLOM|nr:19634_t:CDS:2 [Funneliformis geosporum]CAI2180735.1 14835_t:CDS:2 [Funneliformis geosporum]